MSKFMLQGVTLSYLLSPVCLVEILGLGQYYSPSQVGSWEQHLGDNLEAKSAHGFVASPDCGVCDHN